MHLFSVKIRSYNLRKNIFEKNTGKIAGGIYSTVNKNVFIDDINMKYNNSTKNAGAIYNDLCSNVTIQNSEFQNNKAILTTGGVLFVDTTVGLKVLDSTFINNFSYIYSGVTWLENSENILF